MRRAVTRYGRSVALIVIGAILYLAVNIKVQPLDISLVDLILMIAGAIWLVVNPILEATTRRRRVVTVEEPREIIRD